MRTPNREMMTRMKVWERVNQRQIRRSCTEFSPTERRPEENRLSKGICPQEKAASKRAHHRYDSTDQHNTFGVCPTVNSPHKLTSTETEQIHSHNHLNITRSADAKIEALIETCSCSCTMRGVLKNECPGPHSSRKMAAHNRNI